MKTGPLRGPAMYMYLVSNYDRGCTHKRYLFTTEGRTGKGNIGSTPRNKYRGRRRGGTETRRKEEGQKSGPDRARSVKAKTLGSPRKDIKAVKKGDDRPEERQGAKRKHRNNPGPG